MGYEVIVLHDNSIIDKDTLIIGIATLNSPSGGKYL